MPNVMSVLKQEIARVARHEAKCQAVPVRKATVSQRTDLASLKRRVAALAQRMSALRGAAAKLASAAPAPAAEQAETARVTLKGMRSLQRRLGLTGDEFGKLLGVTGQAVYNWKKGPGALRLRATTRARVLALRGMGARDARRQLAEMASAAKPSGAKRAAKRK
jgi:hypothetical protein